MRESAKTFLLDVSSVILGIAITFSVQGIIDRSQEKQDIRAALDLVRSELKTNIADVSDMADYLYSERTAARYLLEHRKNLKACPDSLVKEYSGIIFANASITLCDDALELLPAACYAPYYLYRQKFSAGGYENVGWAKPGTGCLYNIAMMEELCTVLSLGAGGATKRLLPGGKILRCFNKKYPYEYIGSLEEAERDKRSLFGPLP